MKYILTILVCFCIGSCSRVVRSERANNFLEQLNSPNGREDVELIVKYIENSDRYDLKKKGIVYLVSLKLSFPGSMDQGRLDYLVRKYGDDEVEFIIQNMKSAIKP